MWFTIIVIFFAAVGLVVLTRVRLIGALIWTVGWWFVMFGISVWAIGDVSHPYVLSGIIATIVAGFVGGDITGRMLNREADGWAQVQENNKQRAADLARKM
jgi:prolipoprotein diacylglyceryltransferase